MSLPLPGATIKKLKRKDFWLAPQAAPVTAGGLPPSGGPTAHTAGPVEPFLKSRGKIYTFLKKYSNKN